MLSSIYAPLRSSVSCGGWFSLERNKLLNNSKNIIFVWMEKYEILLNLIKEKTTE